MEATQVVNGVVRVGDWVRELPANHHFQPCYCCLCKPVSGSRPSLQVKGIGHGRQGVYFRFSDGSELPAEEYERVPPPESLSPQPTYPSRSTLEHLLRTSSTRSS